MTSAHDFEEVYTDLGIDLKTLGCVMLGTEVPDTSFIKNEDLYYSHDPKLPWVNGRAMGSSHITLKYGLLNSVRRKHVLKVIEGAPVPRKLLVDSLMKFDSPYPDEPYDCIVGRVNVDPALSTEVMDLHKRLNYLPHVNTFPDYKPHVTLAYVRKGWYDEYADELWDKRFILKTTELNFGKMQ